MRTRVEFRSDAFPPYPDEEAEVNPGRFGKRLAEFLTGELQAHGFRTSGITAEDWGWRVDLENDAFPLWIGCGNYDEFEHGFLCFIEPSKPIRKWFSKTETAPTVERLASAVESVLSNAGVAELRWWSPDEART